MYTTYVAFTNEIAEAEDDDYLRVFSDHEIRTAEITSWLHHWMLEKKTMLDPKLIEPEGYDEMMAKIAESLTPRATPPRPPARGAPPRPRRGADPPGSARERLAPFVRGLPPVLLPGRATGRARAHRAWSSFPQATQ
jgi:hypothetical protein